jgi:hypothetical protein
VETSRFMWLIRSSKQPAQITEHRHHAWVRRPSNRLLSTITFSPALNVHFEETSMKSPRNRWSKGAEERGMCCGNGDGNGSSPRLQEKLKI